MSNVFTDGNGSGVVLGVIEEEGEVRMLMGNEDGGKEDSDDGGGDSAGILTCSERADEY